MEGNRAIDFRLPKVEDAAALWSLIKSAGNLDLNASYAYLLLSSHFAESCVLAYAGDTLVGAVTGYFLPKANDTLFVWQVAVDQQARGRGIALEMLVHLIHRHGPKIRYIQTTVSPSNQASRRLFEKLSVRLETKIIYGDGFSQALFPDAHEDEPLLTLGPLETPPLPS